MAGRDLAAVGTGDGGTGTGRYGGTDAAKGAESDEADDS